MSRQIGNFGNDVPPSILLIAPYCFPATNAEAIVNAKLAVAMIEAGWNVEVVTYPHDGTHWYPSDLGPWKDLMPRLHFARNQTRISLGARVKNAVRGFRIMRFPMRNSSVPLSIADCACDLARKNRFDVIMSRSYPLNGHLAAVAVSRRTNIPWLANWNDPIPNAKFPSPYGQGPKARIPRSYQSRFEAISNACSWHTFPCERLRDYMCSYLPGALQTRSSVIPHIALKRSHMAATRRGVFTLVHAGHLQPPRDATVLFKGLKRFAERLPAEDRVQLILVGDRMEEASRAASDVGVQHLIKLVPPKAYAQMAGILAEADVLVIVEAPVKEGIFLPSKFVDYVEAGRPILALSPRPGSIGDLLTQHGGGIAADVQSPVSVSSALDALYGLWKDGTLPAYASRSLLSLFQAKTVLELHLQAINYARSNARAGAICLRESTLAMARD